MGKEKRIKFEFQEKLVKFEKYLRRQGMSPYIKKKIMFRFLEVFEKEMVGTLNGDKWRKSVYGK